MRVVRAYYERGEWSLRYPVALKRVQYGLKVVKPYYRVGYAFSPNESWYYKEEDVDVLLYLEQIGGNRYVSMQICVLYGRQCDAIKQFAKKLWVEEWKSEKEVEQTLETLIV